MFIKKISIGIKNLIDWFPVIWEDRQWDNAYLEKILIRKMELMKEFYENPKNCVQVDESRLEIVETLANAIELYNHMDDHIDLWWEEVHPNFETMSDEDRKAALNKSLKIEQESHERFWDYIKTNVRLWWD